MQALQMLNWRAARQAAASELGHFSSWALPHDVTVLESNIEKRKEDALRKAAEPKMDEAAEADAAAEAKLDRETGAGADGEGEGVVEGEEGGGAGDGDQAPAAEGADATLDNGVVPDEEGKVEGVEGVTVEAGAQNAQDEVKAESTQQEGVEAAADANVAPETPADEVAAAPETVGEDDAPTVEEPVEERQEKTNRPPTPELPPPVSRQAGLAE